MQHVTGLSTTSALTRSWNPNWLFQICFSLHWETMELFFDMRQTDLESFVTRPDDWDEMRQHQCAAMSKSNSAVITTGAFRLDSLLGRILTSLDDRIKSQKVEEEDADAARPLYLCARYDNVEVLRLALPNVAALNPHGGYFGNPLHAALSFWPP